MLSLLALTACGGGGGNGPALRGVAVVPSPPAVASPHSQCTMTAAKSEVLSLFREYYLFNDDINYPGQRAKYDSIETSLGSYPDVDALLDALRYQSGLFDRGFTGYATREEVEQFYSAGEFVGFGFSMGVDATGAWRLLDVYSASPAADAQWRRGDTILAVDGTATSALNPNDPANFGPATVGLSRQFRIRALGGGESVVTLTKRTVALDPVPADRVRVFDVGGRQVGYLFFRTFIEDSDPALRAAVRDLVGAGVQDLVIDVRYNGGGLVSTAEVLGGLLVGPARAGQLYYEYQHNPSLAASYDEPRFFPLEAEGFAGLENIFYLTDSGTASASELTLSGVLPYVPTVSVGARTFGKPVGQWGLRYCNDSMVLFLVTFRTVNSAGDSDYFAGIPADCAAPDDWNHPLGDPAEGRLAAALDYIASNGSLCTTAAVSTSASRSGGAISRTPPPEQGATLAERLLRSY